MRSFAAFFLLSLPAFADDAKPGTVVKQGAYPTLINPNCSHCIDEANRRKADLKADDPVLVWTRGYSDGGVIPIRFFLAPYRVISDSYGVFVYDPDAGYARGFAPGFTFRFHGWRNGVMTMKDERDGTVYSCLSGVGVSGPKLGHRLPSVPTLTSQWGHWTERYPHAVAYHMFEKYTPIALPTTEEPESVKSRGTPDPRRKPDEIVLGVRVGDVTRAYPLDAVKKAGILADTVGSTAIFVLYESTTNAATAYTTVAEQPREYLGPRPDKDGISPPNPGTPLPAGTPAEEPKPVELEIRDGKLVTKGTTDRWDFAGRCQAGTWKGWALQPVDALACKWFAWAAEYPTTDIYAAPAKKPESISGRAEFLRLLPKPWATVKAVNPTANTVTLLMDGETVAKSWPVEADAEIKIAGWWGRLSQFTVGQRVWVWLRLSRDKSPVSVAMIADEASEWDFHARLKKGSTAPPAATGLNEKKIEQQRWLSAQWDRDGLPGTLAFAHVFSGELDLMLDHEAMHSARSLEPGDRVRLATQPPILAQVKHVTAWRERTQVRLVVGELAAADLKLGQRLGLLFESKPTGKPSYPAGLGRTRSKPERVEWLLASMYCTCGVGKDICTGMFYTLASCNPNGCGDPDGTREQIAKLIDAGRSDEEIWDALLKERGPEMTRPHLRP